MAPPPDDDDDENVDAEEETEEEETDAASPLASLVGAVGAVLGHSSVFAGTSAEDFHDDPGDWSAADYLDVATKIFGGHSFFGDTAHQRYLDEGLQLHDDHDSLLAQVIGFAGEAAGDLLTFYKSGDTTIPRGILTSTALA